MQTVEGLVTGVKIKEDYASITLKTKNGNVLICMSGDYSSDTSMLKVYSLVGRWITATGKISKPSERQNPLCFDYSKYCLSQKIYELCSCSKYKIKGQKIVRPISNYLSCSKAKFYASVNKIFDSENFGIFAGILFGESSYIDEDIYDSFRENGFAHILAVSGLHVNITYELIRKILKSNSKATDFFSILFILFYIMLANYSVSVIRAGIMIILKILSSDFNRPYDSISAASVVVIAFLITNPYKIYDSGLQLSFCAAYSMSIVNPWLTIKLGKLSDKLKKEYVFSFGKKLIPTVSAVIGTAPLSAFHFLNFSVSSILLNPLVIYIASYVMPAGLCLYLMFLILPEVLYKPLSFVLASADEVFIDVLIRISKLGNALFKNTSCTAIPLGLLIIYYVIFFFFFSEGRYLLHRRNRLFEIGILESLLLCLGTVIPFKLGITSSVNPFEYGTAYITFLDVGQGDCIHIHKGNTDILIDGGGKYSSNIAETTLKPYLLKNGIKDIDLAIITHEDSDHCKGIYELSEIFDVKEIKTNKDIYNLSNIEKSEENDYCIVMKINVQGLDLLLMSDADIEREEKLLSMYPELSCDVIKIGHHGSTYSTGEAFIKETKPKLAIISVGVNNYGHPSERVLQLLDSLEVPYARTDECGAIYLKSISDGTYVFENVSKEQQWVIKK